MQSVAEVASVPTSFVNYGGAIQGRRLLAGTTVKYSVGPPTLAPTAEPVTIPIGSSSGGGGVVGGGGSVSGGSSGGAACFAASELVTLESGATKAIANIQVGDRILTVNA